MQPEKEEHMMHDGHCWYLAVVEGEEEISPAIAGNSYGM